MNAKFPGTDNEGFSPEAQQELDDYYAHDRGESWLHIWLRHTAEAFAEWVQNFFRHRRLHG